MENNAASSKKPLTKKPNNMTTTLNKTKTMKGIYLTEEGKKEIEAKIDEFERYVEEYKNFHNIQSVIITKSAVYKEILSSATILPAEVEKLNGNW